MAFTPKTRGFGKDTLHTPEGVRELITPTHVELMNQREKLYPFIEAMGFKLIDGEAAMYSKQPAHFRRPAIINKKEYATDIRIFIAPDERCMHVAIAGGKGAEKDIVKAISQSGIFIIDKIPTHIDSLGSHHKVTIQPSETPKGRIEKITDVMGGMIDSLFKKVFRGPDDI